MLRNTLLLIKKNLILKKRHWFLTLAEFLIPVTLFIALAFVRSNISGISKTYVKDAVLFEPIKRSNIYSYLKVDDLQLWYAPHTDFTEEIVRRVQEKLEIQGEDVREFDSRDKMISASKCNCTLTTRIAAISFNFDNVPYNLDYDLTIYEKFLSWKTERLYESVLTADNTSAVKYLEKGYTALQLAIDFSYMELFTNVDNINFYLKQFPYPPHVEDPGLMTHFRLILPLATILSFVFLCPAVLQRVGEEKASGIREYLKMLGVKSSSIWISWLIHALTTNFISIILIVIILKTCLFGVSYSAVEYSDGTILFLFLFLYCISAITFCFLVATIFKNPSLATIIGILFWLFSYFIPQGLVQNYDTLSWLWKLTLGVFSNMNLFHGFACMAEYELRETGLQWSNFFQPASGNVKNDFTMGHVFAMFLFDIIFFMTCTLYIENFRPGKYGIPKPWYFPLLYFRKFVKKCFTRKSNNTFENQELEEIGLNNAYIQFIKLRKQYDDHVAVNDLNLNIDRNQIFLLLGQNGAGKTTTMSILTGLINATSGTVKIGDKDIRTDTDELRKIMGLCTQHNLLFPSLTVLEQLEFFGNLKGSLNPRKEAEELLEKLNLRDKTGVTVDCLSGGMKRKLCLAIALIGNPELLVLDEPTSAIDPESRRKIWNILIENKKSKTIIISTHFMEEADVLADKIAIMAEGKLCCLGTANELKKQYNTGNVLSLFLANENSLNYIIKAVKAQFSESEIIKKSEDFVGFLLPTDKKREYKFLIEELERHHDWGIKSMSLAETTLDDVFLKTYSQLEDTLPGVYVSNTNYDDPEDSSCCLNKLFILLLKRWYFLKRRALWYFLPILMSVFLFVFAISLPVVSSQMGELSPKTFTYHLERYGQTKVFYSSNNSISKLEQNYKQVAQEQNANVENVSDVSSAIIKEGESNIVFYNKHLIAASIFDETSNGMDIITMFNTEQLHGIPISVNLATNAILKTILNDSYSITTRHTPFKFVCSQISLSGISFFEISSAWIVLIPFSMFFLSSIFIFFPFAEVSTNFLRIQIIAGAQSGLYWLSNIIFDCLLSLVPFSLFFGLMFLINYFNCKTYMAEEFYCLMLILGVYTVASLPFTYIFSYRETITKGFSLLIMCEILIGIVPALVINAIELSSEEKIGNIIYHVEYILSICSPQFALSHATVKFSKKFVDNFNWRNMEPSKKEDLCKVKPNPCCYGAYTTMCQNYQSYFLNEQFGIQFDIYAMLIAPVIYFIILCVLSSNSIKFLFQKSENEEIDEERGENKKINNNNKLVVNNLKKCYGKQTVVEKIKFILKKSKCFGLLGVNGAGKSTIFQILTKSLCYDEGDVKLENISIKKQNYSDKIGYCPQENCLNFGLTGRELLSVMARLKGYSKSSTKKKIGNMLKLFDIESIADKLCSQYSGGNKRKICACIAFLGKSRVVFLDEPTNGVDPRSRRKFWNVLNECKKKQAFLLCSHSMEECENLCDEIAIMRKGKIVERAESIESLKEKHEKGYKISIRFDTKIDDTKLHKIKKFASEISCELLEETSNKEFLIFQVTDNKKRLSGAFSVVQKFEDEFKNIADYAVNQISLEDIFLRVAENN